MSKGDKLIAECGFVMVDDGGLCHYLVYESDNERDCRAMIQWDQEIEDECLIGAETISKEPDWFGRPERQSAVLTLKECEAFLTKLKELIQKEES